MKDAMRRLRRVVHVSVALAFVPVAAHAAKPIHVLPGTEVQLVLKDALSSQTATKGQKISLVVAQDVLVQGRIVIPEGSPAAGVVVRAEPNGTFGKPGVLQLRVRSVTLGDQRIPLFYSSLARGKESETSAVVLTALFGPVGILKHGKAVEVPAGTKLLAYIDQAFDVSVDEPLAPAPVTDDAAAPPVAPASDRPAEAARDGIPPAPTASPTPFDRTTDGQKVSSD